MKMKKFFYLAMSAVIASAMTSCGEEEEVLGPASLKAEVSEVNLSAEGETKTFELKATRDWSAEIIGSDVEGIDVSPLSGKASNDPVTITVKAAKNEGKNRTATIKFTASATLTAIVTVSQDGSLGNLKSIAEVLALSSGVEAETEGVVVGTYTRGFVIKDDTGYLLAYNENYTAPGVELNSKVKVAGTTSAYGDLPQITPASVTTLETGLTVAEPNWLEVNKDNIENLDLTKCQPIKMTGALSISGYHYNLSIDGTTVQGSISYPLESLGLADLAGHIITVYGYFAGGNNANFRNILAVSVQDEGEPETPTSTIAEVIAAEKGSLVKTEATVMAIHKKGYILGDATGTIYVYTNDEPTVAVGNKILISGTTDNHYGTVQIKSATIEENDGSTATPTYPEPVDLTGLEAFNAFTVNTDKIDITYAKLSGVMQSSGYFLKRDGANHDIQLSNIYESYTDLAGAEFTVTGYIYGFNSGSKYYQVIPVSVETQPYLKAEKTEITVPATETTATFKILANVSWKAASASGAWTVSKYTQTGNGTGDIVVEFDANAGDSRSVVLNVTSDELPGYTLELTLIQQSADVTYTNWTKVTSAPSDWTGKYLIVYEEGGKYCDGSAADMGAAAAAKDVELNEGTIAGSLELEGAYVTVEKYGTGYAIKSAAGKYIYQSGDNNGIKTSNALSDAVVLNITLEDGKTVISPTDGKTKFVYNKSSKMFRFYKNATISGNTGGYPIVNLFKASE